MFKIELIVDEAKLGNVLRILHGLVAGPIIPVPVPLHEEVATPTSTPTPTTPSPSTWMRARPPNGRRTVDVLFDMIKSAGAQGIPTSAAEDLLEIRLNLQRQSAGPRLSDLVRAGLVEFSGDRANRMWKVTRRGRDHRGPVVIPSRNGSRNGQ
jgi:hypothetical protein